MRNPAAMVTQLITQVNKKKKKTSDAEKVIVRGEKEESKRPMVYAQIITLFMVGNMLEYIYIYIYIYTHTHTHTHTEGAF